MKFFYFFFSIQFSLFANFQGFEIIKTDFSTHSLQIHDLDNDSKNEIIIANRSKGSIDIFIQREKQNVDPKELIAQNFLAYNQNWEQRSIALDRDIYSLKVFDFDRNGLLDLVYHGSPKGLVILLQDSPFSFKKAIHFNIDQGLMHYKSLIVRSLEQNSEIVVQQEHARTHLLINQKLKIENRRNYPVPSSIQGQFSGMKWGKTKSGLNGLWIEIAHPQTPILFYAHHKEIYYEHPSFIKIPQTRFLVSGHFKDREYLDWIQVRTQRGQLQQVDLTTSIPNHQTQSFSYHKQTIPYFPTKSRRFSFLLHDINRDSATDFLVAHLESAQIEVFLSNKDSWLPSKLFPSYKNIDFLLADKKGISLASQSEGLIGHTLMDTQKLSFPKARATKYSPIAFLKNFKTSEIEYLFKKEGQLYLKTQKDELKITMETPFPQKGISIPLSNNAFPELVFEIPYQGLKLFSWNSNDKTYSELKSVYLKNEILSELNLNTIDFIPNKNTYDISLTEGNHIRRYRFIPNIHIIEQINNISPDSKINLHQYHDLNLDQIPELITYDANKGSCDIYEKKNIQAPYQWVQSLEAPRQSVEKLQIFSRFKNSKPEILLLGQGECTWYHQQQKLLITPQFEQLQLGDAEWQYSYIGSAIDWEPQLLQKLCLIDSNLNYVDLFSHHSPWKRDLSFRVFEEKSFQQKNQGGSIREVTSSHLKNPGLPAQLILVHDRILVYQR